MMWLYFLNDEAQGSFLPWPPYQEGLASFPHEHNDSGHKYQHHFTFTAEESTEMMGRLAPGTLYKYRDIENKFHFDLLEKLSLWIPRFSTLNDPFDGNFVPKFDCDSYESKRQLRIFNKREIRQALTIVPSNPNNTTALKRTIKWIGGLNGKNLWEAKVKFNHQRMTHLCWGVSCFSHDAENTLMWSHYANSHSGFCVGFDRQHLCVDYMRHTRRIYSTDAEYCDDLPQLPIYDDELALIVQLFSIKASKWNYEKEHRIFTPAICGKAINLSPRTITDITLGMKISKTNKDRVLDIVNKNLQHVKVFEAYAGDNFQIKRKQLY